MAKKSISEGRRVKVRKISRRGADVKGGSKLPQPKPGYDSPYSYDSPFTQPIILAEAAPMPESQMSSLEKMGLARQGISKRDLESLKEKAGLDYDKIAKALSVTRATLINKKGKEKFSPTISERIVSLADLYSYGFEVFEDEERFNYWMSAPNTALGGKAPIDIVDNQFGREEIRAILGRIEYGVYS